MKLSKALRLSPACRVAVVGAGGKTTALFRLAGELRAATQSSPQSAAVLVTTTTHLSAAQVLAADHHWIATEPAHLEALERSLPAGIIAITGPRDANEPDRLCGLSGRLLESLYELSVRHGLPLLVEADGARQKLLKAPGDHEPSVPDFVEVVIVVANLAALGRPLDAERVHRPERFAALAGVRVGEPVTIQALQAVLLHPAGGLRNIPAHARRVALLNGAGEAWPDPGIRSLVGQLLGSYQAVLAGSPLKNRSAGDELSGSSQAQGTGPILAVYEPVAGVVLAAGGASRYGITKQLLPWRGEALVRHVTRTALEAGLAPVVMVAGAQADQIRQALADLPVRLVENPAWAAGQSSSLQAGLKALPPETGAAVFLLADQPQIPAALVDALLEQHARTLAPLVAPRIGGRRANPVLIDRMVFPALHQLSGDTGARPLFADPDRFPVTWVEWDDPGLLLDVDTPEDYRRLLEG